MNKLERTLRVYELLNIRLNNLERVEFFKPMFELLAKYDANSLGMIKNPSALATYSVTNHHELSDKTEWVIENQSPLVKLTIKRMTTEAQQDYVVYLYNENNSYRIKEWYKK